MRKAILFGIWLNIYCTAEYNLYVLKETDIIYWLDTDMEKLYDIFKRSDYYKNSKGY